MLSSVAYLTSLSISLRVFQHGSSTRPTSLICACARPHADNKIRARVCIQGSWDVSFLSIYKLGNFC